MLGWFAFVVSSDLSDLFLLEALSKQNVGSNHNSKNDLVQFENLLFYKAYRCSDRASAFENVFNRFIPGSEPSLKLYSGGLVFVTWGVLML